jgi:hypothetical protein
MTDRPILFSAPMVRALLEGRKAQTRRVLKPQPHDSDFCGPGIYHPTIERRGEEQPGKPMFGIWAPDGFWTQRLPVAPGARLWVKETYVGFLGPLPGDWSRTDTRTTVMPDGQPVHLHYRADNQDAPWPHLGWKSGRYMPRWASRLTLLVTDVRVQRLQDISEADAIAEGIERRSTIYDRQWFRNYGSAVGWFAKEHRGALFSFESLWNSIHGPEAWAENPWVAAISFDVVRANIDQVQG